MYYQLKYTIIEVRTQVNAPNSKMQLSQNPSQLIQLQKCVYMDVCTRTCNITGKQN